MEKKLGASARRRIAIIPSQPHGGRAIAAAYNQAGDNYLAYADGDARKLYAFAGQYAYGDGRIWEVLFSKLCALRATGKRSLRVLDLGCGPGTWLRRMVTRARAIGFDDIVARGFDIADAQVRRARELSADLAGLPGVALNFEVGDILRPLPEVDGSVDIVLCLCGVLNHLPAAQLPAIMAEIGRVTSGVFISSVRAAGSTPTLYVDAMEHARRFRQDNDADRLDAELDDGRRITLPSHLFGSSELAGLVSPHLKIEDLAGLDLFHGRFADDPRWNAPARAEDGFVRELDRLEKSYCRDARFIDHATHLLLIARRPS
ncbi:MAG: class I SAM-dependent methyltransferase [Rhizomicrobium sp.]